MNCQREMTLDEWVGRLLPDHRACRELAELRTAREAAEAAVARMREDIERLRTPGCMLANIAFNVAQGQAVSDRTRELLATWYREWDKTLNECSTSPELRALLEGGASA